MRFAAEALAQRACIVLQLRVHAANLFRRLLQARVDVRHGGCVGGISPTEIERDRLACVISVLAHERTRLELLLVEHHSILRGCLLNGLHLSYGVRVGLLWDLAVYKVVVTPSLLRIIIFLFNADEPLLVLHVGRNHFRLVVFVGELLLEGLVNIDGTEVFVEATCAACRHAIATRLMLIEAPFRHLSGVK